MSQNHQLLYMLAIILFDKCDSVVFERRNSNLDYQIGANHITYTKDLL
jgi:hypothetical protein